MTDQIVKDTNTTEDNQGNSSSPAAIDGFGIGSFDPRKIIHKIEDLGKDLGRDVEQVASNVGDVTKIVKDVESKLQIPTNWLGTLETDLNTILRFSQTSFKALEVVFDEAKKDAANLGSMGGYSLVQGIENLANLRKANVAANAAKHTASTAVELFKEAYENGEQAGAEIKSDITALTASFKQAGENVLNAIGNHIPDFATSGSIERKMLAQLSAGLDFASNTIKQIPDEVLSPLGAALPSNGAHGGVKRLGILSDVVSKLDTFAELISKPPAGTLKKAAEVARYAVVVVASGFAEFANWLVAAFPLSINLSASLGGAAGVFADIGASTTVMNVTALVMKAFSAILEWLIQVINFPLDVIWAE